MGVGMMLCCDVGKKEEFRLTLCPPHLISCWSLGCCCFVRIVEY